MNEAMVQGDGRVDPSAQHQALHVLTMAQRTAEEHVAGARRTAETIVADAHGRAEQVIRDAQARVHALQQEAEKALADAHAKAAQVAQDAEAHADDVQRRAEDFLSEARERAGEMEKDARARAEELMHRAEQRYEDIVGSLAAKREALQRQIETLEDFDREYRGRLTTFLQSQLRSLWVDEPRVDPEAIEEESDSGATITALHAAES